MGYNVGVMHLRSPGVSSLLCLVGSLCLPAVGCGKEAPSTDDAYFLREGRLALSQGKLTRAVALLGAAVAIDPDGAEPRRQLAQAHLQANQTREAEKCLREGLARRPKDPGLWLDLGRLLARSGRHEEATRALEKALHQGPHVVEAVLALGEIYEQHGQGSAAAALYRATLSKASVPGRLRLHRRLARMAQRDGRYEVAIEELRQALSLCRAEGQGDSVKGEVTADLGDVLRAAGRPAEARTTLEEAVRLRPADGQARLNLGLVVAELEDHKEAAAVLAKAAELLPGRPEPLAALARSQAALGNNEAAYKAGTEALALDPTSSAIQWLMVAQYVERGLLGPAEDLLGQLLGVRGHDPAYWEQAARVAEGRADHAKAREAWARALTLRPRDPSLRRNLAFAARRAGAYQAALRDIEPILAEKPDDYDALVHQGIALELIGQRVKAQAALDRAQKSQPERHEAHVYLAWLALRKRQLAAALDAALLADRLAEGKSAHALDVLSKALSSLGRTQDALAALDRALALPLTSLDRAYFAKEKETLASSLSSPVPQYLP